MDWTHESHIEREIKIIISQGGNIDKLKKLQNILDSEKKHERNTNTT